ncbi:MAG: hemin receptor [Bacteroidales bacterium]|nr:hemin receptor [Bacteroidales bacterium]
MKKIMTIAAMAVSISAAAQDTYQSAQLAGDDLNGTARYVGMGGAMEALGADISTMGTNPAGIGLFRKSQVSISGGLQIFGGNYENNSLNSYLDGNKTTGSFDQVGIVLSTKAGHDSYINFGFNFHKSKNFNQLLAAANSLNEASLNKVSFNKFKDVVTDDKNFYDPSYSTVDWFNDQLMNPYATDNEGNYVSSFNGYFNAQDFTQHQVQTGYIGDYDFNISGNIHNRVYLGLTFGIKDVHYESRSLYTENIFNEKDEYVIGDMFLDDSRIITGTGFNVKFGAIFRPVDDSPFRIGAYIHTPTWYKLTTSNYTEMTTYDIATDKIYGKASEDHLDFKLNTPWLFGVSVGHTVGNFLALGATYEYSDYGALDNRVIDNSYSYDYYYDYYYGNESSFSDKAMKRNTEKSLQGVHTLRLGAEVKLCPEVALRVGYNYVSPKYQTYGCRDTDIPSQGVEFASTAAYTNWKDTNRFTCGIGYAKGSFSVDLAYKYSQTNGDFYPFYDGIGTGEYENNPGATSVSDKRHQLLMTLGYRF